MVSLDIQEYQGRAYQRCSLSTFSFLLPLSTRHMSAAAMSTLFAHVSSLFHSVVAAHLSLDELSLVLVVLVILDSYNFLVISWLASSVSAWFRSISHAFLLRFTTSKKTKLPTDPQSRRTSHVSCRIKVRSVTL